MYSLPVRFLFVVDPVRSFENRRELRLCRFWLDARVLAGAVPLWLQTKLIRESSRARFAQYLCSNAYRVIAESGRKPVSVSITVQGGRLVANRDRRSSGANLARARSSAQFGRRRESRPCLWAGRSCPRIRLPLSKSGSAQAHSTLVRSRPPLRLRYRYRRRGRKPTTNAGNGGACSRFHARQSPQ